MVRTRETDGGAWNRGACPVELMLGEVPYVFYRCSLWGWMSPLVEMGFLGSAIIGRDKILFFILRLGAVRWGDVGDGHDGK